MQLYKNLSLKQNLVLSTGGEHGRPSGSLHRQAVKFYVDFYHTKKEGEEVEEKKERKLKRSSIQ